jgi:selenocysteine lyase/cysteine desulfurase
VSCCYKWLFGTHGVGVFFVNNKRWPDLQPITIGWNSVHEEDDLRRDVFELKPGMDRFEFGNLSFLSIYLLENGIARLEEAGIPAIEDHVMALGGELRSGLVRLDLDLLTPEAPRQRAGNICFATDRWASIEAHLRANGILTWGDAGRLRISVHAYNDTADVERVLDELEKVRSQI